MEEKKNEEIAKLRDIIETEIKEEQSKYLRKLVSQIIENFIVTFNLQKERIGELEDKLHFYENIGPPASSILSPTLPQGMINSFTTAGMQESCHVVKDEEEKAIQVEEEKAESEDGREKDDEDGDLAIVTVSKNSVGTQTKLRLRDM